MKDITITAVVINEDVTAIANFINLSDGRTIEIGNGNACYSSPHDASGPLFVGSPLLFEEELEDGSIHYAFGRRKKVAYPTDNHSSFLFRNTSSLEAKVSMLRQFEEIPPGWEELTEAKWGGPLPILG